MLETPDWAETFPGENEAELRCREVAARRWASALGDLMGRTKAELPEAVGDLLKVYAETYARWDYCVRNISVRGMTKETDRGPTKRPEVTEANQLRGHLLQYAKALGLSEVPKASAPVEADPLMAFVTGE